MLNESWDAQGKNGKNWISSVSKIIMCRTCEYIRSNIRLDKLTEDLIYKSFDELVSEGKVSDLGLVDPKSPQRTTKYICNECNATWLFTCPDHAFKGELMRE